MKENPKLRPQFVADLRALADLLERETSLPIPHEMEGTAYPSGITADKGQQVAMVFAGAELLGASVEHDRVHGTLSTSLSIGRVCYRMYIKVGSPAPQREDVVTVSSPEQFLGAEAVAR